MTRRKATPPGGDDVVVPLTPAEQVEVDASNAAWEAPEAVKARRNELIKEKRQAEYGPIGDQLDMIYHDEVDGATKWKDHIAAVKAANPKV